ncbi:uncharacterized protein LOC115337813 [Aquila chrysaetos chrysaetos]|uniref:uncharacterized protein LOC115337813 n=1 Tax=Aquila chrysaetos chrysaetos TaxID=223781 RepID=UPI001176F743|nr:uncharacterized protein LOC115337813 [Aquila chrysaetos chrysaetos]
MNGNFMWKSFKQSVEIQITSEPEDVTLYNPRSYCYSGYSSMRIPLGVTESCEFTNSVICFRDSMGLLVYEADAFTLAILFSNPFDYNIFSVELAMEISFRKAHLGNLENIYTRMSRSQSASTGKDTVFHRVKLGACQEAAVVFAGHVRVTATMSSAAKSVIKIIVEYQDSFSSEFKGGTTY